MGNSSAEKFTVSVRDAQGDPVGLGVLVGPSLVLTCAHVVDAAVDRTPGSWAPPAKAVYVSWPLLDDAREIESLVRDWLPAPP